jgi:hypothetical protein
MKVDVVSTWIQTTASAKPGKFVSQGELVEYPADGTEFDSSHSECKLQQIGAETQQAAHLNAIVVASM